MKLISNDLLEIATNNAVVDDRFNDEMYAKMEGFKLGAEYAEYKILPQIFEMLTWASKNNYEPIHDGRWVKRFMSFTISSEELFNKWLKEKDNEN